MVLAHSFVSAEDRASSKFMIAPGASRLRGTATKEKDQSAKARCHSTAKGRASVTKTARSAL